MKYIFIVVISLINTINTDFLDVKAASSKNHKKKTQQNAFSQINSSLPYYFRQKIDHLNDSDSRTFEQKYYVQPKYFNNINGSVLLYLCGQWECSNDYLQIYQFLAVKAQALIIALEHRYYGQSLPMGLDSLDLQNLVYLTVQQVLQDTKQFILDFKDRNKLQMNNNPWFVVGDSYSGLLAGWFRLNYPKLVFGAVSSSGVFYLSQQYPKFDMQVYNTLLKNSKACVNRVIYQTIEAQSILRIPDKGLELKKQLAIQQMTDDQFLYYLTGIVTFYVQYGQRNKLCQYFKQSPQYIFFQILDRKLRSPNIIEGVSKKSMKNPQIYKTAYKRQRAWRYQVCTQIGLFCVASNTSQRIRSKILNGQFFRNRCLDIYGQLPNITKTYQLYGNFQNITNLISVSGVQDPWRWASIQQNRTNVFSFIIDCQQCSHCIFSKLDANKSEILQVREYATNIIYNWINDYWQSQKPQAQKQQNKYWAITLFLIFGVSTLLAIIIKFGCQKILILTRSRFINENDLNEQNVSQIIKQKVGQNLQQQQNISENNFKQNTKFQIKNVQQK